MKEITIKEDWLTDHITIGDASRLCQELESNLQDLKASNRDLRDFHYIASIAYGLINNPYDSVCRTFRTFENTFENQIHRIKDQILQYTVLNEKVRRKPKMTLKYFLEIPNVYHEDVSIRRIEDFNRCLRLYNEALENRDEIFMKACRLSDDVECIMGRKYENDNDSKTLAVFNDIQRTDTNIVFYVTEYRLHGWTLISNGNTYLFDDIMESQLYRPYLKENFAEEYI